MRVEGQLGVGAEVAVGGARTADWGDGAQVGGGEAGATLGVEGPHEGCGLAGRGHGGCWSGARGEQQGLCPVGGCDEAVQGRETGEDEDEETSSSLLLWLSLSSPPASSHAATAYPEASSQAPSCTTDPPRLVVVRASSSSPRARLSPRPSPLASPWCAGSSRVHRVAYQQPADSIPCPSRAYLASAGLSRPHPRLGTLLVLGEPRSPVRQGFQRLFRPPASLTQLSLPPQPRPTIKP